MSKFMNEVPVECQKDIKSAVEKCGLNWSVNLMPLVTMSKEQMLGIGANPSAVDKFDKTYSTPVNKYASVRMDDGSILGVVGKNYTPLQNDASFNFFQPFLDSGECELETIGCLFNGTKTFVSAKINRKDLDMGGGDYIQKRIMLFNSHDGSSSVRAGFIARRVVCFNQMPMINRNKDSSIIRFKHASNVESNLLKIRDIINAADATFEATAEQYRKLQNYAVNKDDIVKYVKLILEVDDDIKTRTQNKIDELVGYCLNSPGADGKTLFSVLNGITYYTSHQYGRNEENRFDSLNFGASMSLNERALKVLSSAAI